MSDQKIKAASDKVPMNLLPLRALKGVARVFGYGARKYAAGNFLTADDDKIGDRYSGGLLRHLAAAQRPDGLFDLESLAAIDDESGLPEIDHGICGLIMLRALLIKRGALSEDPGIGNDPHKTTVTLRFSGVDIRGYPGVDIGRLHLGVGATDKSGKNTLIPENALPMYGGDGKLVAWSAASAANAGTGTKSVPVYSAEHDRAPRDVHAPSIYPEGDPAGRRPQCPSSECAIRGVCTGSSGCNGSRGRPMAILSRPRIAVDPADAVPLRAAVFGGCPEYTGGEDGGHCGIVRNPCPMHGAYTLASPRPTGPGDAPSTSEDRAVPVPSPRFVVMRAEDVPTDAPAEYGPEIWCREFADKYNSGAIKRGEGCWFNPTDPRFRSGNTHAVIDTRPESK